MDRIVPRRPRVLSALAILLSLVLCPAAPGQAKRPDISDMPAGDPGDGVLRPFESEAQAPDATTQTEAAPAGPSRPAPQYLLVPVAAPAGQPWPVVFRLVRIDRLDGTPAWHPTPFGGRWHRAP